MKLIYITNNRLPTEKAHGVQIAKMCEAFANGGTELEILYPKRRNQFEGSFFDYYNLDKNFKLTKIWSFDLVGIIPKIGFRVQSLTFAVSSFLYLIKNKYRGIVYSRDPFSSLLLFLNKKLKIVFEIHSLPREIKFYHKLLFSRVYKFVAISNGLKKDLINLGVPDNKIFVAPDGVDLKSFEKIHKSKEELRDDLGLPQDKKIILYTGHLYDWKGAHILAKASKYLADEFIVVFVGGTEKDLNKFTQFVEKNKLKNVVLLGYQRPDKIPYYLKSADILVLPNSGKQRISSHHTSPMKLFEYMASGVPIIASDLPSIKEVLNEYNAVFFEADNNKDLAEKILKNLKEKKFLNKISHNALIDVKEHTWRERGKKILEIIQK
jgi:glycosyltransferase involved in cell wall biosynthesis